MNRIQLSLAALLGTLLPLVFDSALKGAALLAAAALGALLLYKASAATRHLVWLVAVVALLIVPVLSFALPQWRILPQWTASPLADAAVTVTRPALPPVTEDNRVTQGTAFSPLPFAEPAPVISTPPPARSGPQAVTVPIARRALPVPDPVRTWRDWLPLAWAAGFAFLALRLLAAHLMLRRAARSCTLLTAPPDEFISVAFTDVCVQLGIRRRVTLLLDKKRTIPVVWGVFRPRLLLPAEAREWNEEQLRSVLLHELAHIRRRDALVQWITQIACALHWFNPFVWLAAWRLHTERERACDDLVLASGVRPSVYAEHLLHVATKLSPARWSAACGLAMARKSSLEGRLLAVLSEKLNRRGVTHALAAMALLLGAGIAIPLAMLRAAESDKPNSAAVNAEPKDPASKTLFENWKAGARADGRIPGGRIGEMAASLKSYMDLNAGTEAASKCEAVFKKCDAVHDWTPSDAAALLDEIETAAPSRAEWAMRTNTERTIHPGKPLPDELANAPWGQPAANGLRIAWLLEPRTETQSLDSVMKSRVLFQNTGKAPVCFATEDWIQNGGHKAKDANGKDISVWAAKRLGIRTRMIFRLAPGEYAEVEGHGLGVGSHETSSEKSIYRVGCWIEAKEGDAVTFTPGNIPVSFQTWINNEGLKNSITVWQEMIAARVMREGPMPAATKDREQLLRRVMQDFPGTEPAAGEIATFIADNSPDALAKLTAQLQTRSAPMHFAGELSGGTTKFRVTAAGTKEPSKQGAASGAGTTSNDSTTATATRSGQTLPEGTEAQLDWGEAVNGLRGAVVVRAPQPGAAPGIYLAVQNVSAAALRFSDTIAAEKLRTLYLNAPAGRPLSGMTNGEATKIDAVLQPREVVFLPIFPPGHESHEAAMIEGIRKDALQTWKVVLEIEKAPEGAWKGKLTTAETRGACSLEGPQPKSKEARALFKLWQANARLNGNIPGGLLSRLHDKVKEFIRNNSGDASGDPYAKKMAPLEPRFGVAGDWKPADVVALMDDIAAVTSIPMETTMEHIGQHTLQHGQQLPAALQKADWGEPLPGGLRMAYVLEPRAEAYHLGTEVKARIVLHNSGTEPVAFVTSGFQQPGHSATLGDGGAKFTIDSTFWTTLGRPQAYRLSPGEYCEVSTPGLGIGKANKDRDDWSNVRAGSWILCGEGNDVVFTPGAALLSSRVDGEPDNDDWWLEFITERLMREAPVPQDTKEREYLLYRVVRELFGAAPSTTQGGAFAADKSPDALKNLARLLTKHVYGTPCHGAIRAGETKFRVLPPDPDAAKKPRVASNPGYFTLGNLVRLSVTRRPAGPESVVNDGSVIYFPPGRENVIHDLKLPGGYDTWAAAWGPGTTVLWVSQKGLLRKIDFTDPAKVEETRFEGDKAAGAPIPANLREALRAALTVPDAPKQIQEPLKPATPAPAAEVPNTKKP